MISVGLAAEACNCRHANCRVVSREGVVALGRGSVRAFRHVWLCAMHSLSFLSLSLTVHVCLHITNVLQKIHTSNIPFKLP